MGAEKLGVFKTVRLRAEGAAAVPIGLFESTIEPPQISFTPHPDIGDRLGVSIIKQEDHGDYILLCRLQNFSAQPCTVIIRSSE